MRSELYIQNDLYLLLKGFSLFKSRRHIKECTALAAYLPSLWLFLTAEGLHAPPTAYRPQVSIVSVKLAPASSPASGASFAQRGAREAGVVHGREGLVREFTSFEEFRAKFLVSHP